MRLYIFFFFSPDVLRPWVLMSDWLRGNKRLGGLLVSLRGTCMREKSLFRPSGCEWL